MSRLLTISVLVCAFFATVIGDSCTNPKVSVTSTFSTQDATILTQLAHIGEFTLKCGNGIKPSIYAAFPCGTVVPVAKVGDDAYQISWTEEIKKSSSGNIAIRLFDEDGYANLKKAQRDGDKADSVKPLAEITLTAQRAYKGPWVNAELIVAAVIAGIAYFAMTTKDKIRA